MEAYLPSEVARLVLGYLEEVKCTNTWETFLVESPHLQEYYQLHQQGIKYAANINGKSLLGILQEYRSLINGSSKQSDTQCSCNKTSNPLNSESYATPNKNNRNKFTKFQVNQKIQTQSVVASLKYGQSNVSSSRRLFNASETPHHVNIYKTPKRQMGVHVTALNFGPEAHTVRINDARNCKSTTDKVNFHLYGNNLQNSVSCSVPTVSGSCVSEPEVRICHRTVQTEPLSKSLVDLNAGNHNFQSEQPSASDTVKLNNSENVADGLPAQSNIANTGSSICNTIESSPTCSATESCEELGSSSFEPARPFLTEQLNLESSTKIVSTEDQISIVKQSLVCTSSEVTTCSENVVVTATVENSATPEYIAEPPTYNRAPSTNSPRLILSYDRSQIASLTTPMKDKRCLEEFYSPKRKGFIPRRRLLSESPLPKQVQGNDRTSLAIHEDWPFLDFSCTDTLAQIIAE
ncbi:Protein NPAT, partial [Stegodyphus mimosarum]